ncbi:MAG: hypothetical protein IPQ05_08395 [Leptospiraceae bacterium]|nr:hypothetical protein [Leptospiraceae bacterium]MBK9500994.1 hypothetical protein [Leptospiraceae bacterium]MBL0263881.1 hypothetical protein [Leptospiraceae bacterium]
MKKTSFLTLVVLLAFTFCKKEENSKIVAEPTKNYFSKQWVNYWNAKLEYAAEHEKRLAEAKKLNSQAFVLYKAKKDKEAVELYEKSIDSYPLGETYYNYGNSLSNINRLEDSILAYDVALYLSTPRPELALYNTACSHSRLNQVNEAYEYLAKAIDRGYNAIAYIEKDPDMENLRKDPEWETKIQKLLNPKEYSQSDLVGKLSIGYVPRGGKDYILCDSGVAIAPFDPPWSGQGGSGAYRYGAEENVSLMYSIGKWKMEKGDLVINFEKGCGPNIIELSHAERSKEFDGKGRRPEEYITGLSGTPKFSPCKSISNQDSVVFTKDKVRNIFGEKKDEDVSYNLTKNSNEPKQCDPNFVPKTLEDLKLE